MANSSVVIGKVVVLQGHAYLHTADGRQVELKLGDPVHEGDVIVTAPGAVVQLGFNDGVSYVVHQNETVTLDPSVFAAKDVDSHSAALTSKGADLKQITDVIANGGDLDQLLEAPAAGLGGGGDGNSGHSFVQLVRITEATPLEGNAGNGGVGTSQSNAQNSDGKTGLSGPDAQDSAASEMVGVSHEQSVTIHLTGTDSEASIASFTILSLPTNGTLYLADGKTPVFVGEVIGASGNAANLVFTPSAGTNTATTSFQYNATDTLGVASNVATGTINVTAAPSITIDPIHTVNGANAASSALIAVTGTVGSSVPVGDTVTLSVGGHTYTGTVEAGGTYSIGVPGNVLAVAGTTNLHASVTITDAFGDTGTAAADQPYSVELNATPISITVNPVATVNGAEAGSSSPILVSGTVSSNVPVGDTVTLTVDGHSYSGIVQSGGAYSIGIPGNILGSAGPGSIVATVSSTDAAGNTANASASQAYGVELTAPPIAVSINPISTVNGAEAASSTPVAITGVVTSTAGGPISGDTVIVTVGGQSYTGTVQADGSYSVGVPGNVLANAPTDSIHVTVSGTDPVGNVATASANQSYNVELTAPPIAISIDPIGTINHATLQQGQINIGGNVTSNAGGPIVGDTVTLTVGGQSYTGTVQANGSYSISVSTSVLANAPVDSVHATVSGVDPAGNVATASADQGYGVELNAAPIAVSINSIGTISTAEAASSNPVAISGVVTGSGPIAGDAVVLSVGGQSYTATVQTNGSYTINVPGNILGGASSDVVSVSVSGTDAAGNVASASASQSYAVASSSGASTLTIGVDPIATVNGAEAASSNPVAITGTVTGTGSASIQGDTVTLTVGGQSYTGTVQSNGTYSINVPGNVLGGATTDSVHVSVSGTDSASNPISASTDQAYNVELTAPPIAVSINTIGTITTAEAASSSPVAISGVVTSTSGGPIAGDTVTLAVGGQTYTGTVLANGTYTINVPGNVLGSATTDTVQVSVSGTDAAHNVATASASQNYTVATSGTPSTLTIGVDPIATVNGAEAASSSPVAITGTVTGTGSASIQGDTVTLTVGGQSYTGTVLLNGTYSINVPGNVLAGATTDSVHVSVSGTDSASNPISASTDQAYNVELTAPPIAVSINTIGTITTAEAASSSPVAISGVVTSTSGGPIAGDTVTLAVGGQTYTGTVLANGTYTINVPGNVLGSATTDTVQVSVSGTDAAHNVATASASQNYTVATSGAPSTLTIGVDPIATVNGAEAASSSPVAITGTVTGTGSASIQGDTVTLTVGGQSYTGTVLLNGTYSINVPGNVLAGATTDSVHVSVSGTDSASNPISASTDQAYNVELTAPPISISVNQIATINGAEAVSSASIAITGSVSHNVPAGDMVTLTVAGQSYTGLVLAGGAYSINVPGNVLAGASTDSVHVTVSTTDAAGNTATASADQAYNVELSAPPISISVNSIATINGAEAVSSASIAITGSVSHNVPAGDMVTLTVAGQSYTGLVLAGGAYSINVPGNVLAGASTDSVHVTVSTTDAAGNTATASADQAYNVELSAPPISISVNSIATINGVEAASSASIAITGSVSNNVPAGDTVTLTVAGQSYTGLVLAGGAYSINVPGNVLAGAPIDSVHVTVSTTDAAGNTATASADQAYNVELSAPPISISVNSIATINNAEATSGSSIAITGSVSNNVPVGDTVTLTVAGQSYTGTVQSNGSYSIPVPANVLAGAGTDSVHVAVSTTDAAGNTASASADQAYAVDLNTPDTPGVAINPSSNGVINAPELGSSTTVHPTVTLDASGQTLLSNGGTVQITVNDNGAVQSLNLHLNGSSLVDGSGNSYGYSNGVITLTEVAPGDGNTIKITATETDINGNVSNQASASAVEIVTPLSIAVNINQIGVINHAEGNSNNPIAITGTVTSTDGGPIAGDTVTLMVGGQSYTGTVQSNGTYSFNVPGSILAAASTDTVHVSVSGTDSNGNTSTASASQNYGVDLNVPDAPTVTIPLANAHGFITEAALNGATTVAVNVALDSADQTVLSHNGSVQINVNDNGATQTLNLQMSGSNLVDGLGNTYAYSGGVITLTEAAPGNGNTLTVSSTVTDQYGNVSGSTTTQATQETTLPDAPVVTIPLANAHGFITEAALNGATTVAINVALDSADQTVLSHNGSVQINVNDNGALQALNLQMSGSNLVDGLGNTYAYSGGVITLTEAAPGNGNTLTVSSTVTDQYGNVSGSTTTQATQETTLPDAPVVTIPLANAHGFITEAALNGATTIAVNVALDSADQTVLSHNGSVQINVNDNGALQALNLQMSGSNLVDGLGNTYAYSGGVITLTEAAPGNGNTLTVSSTVTDQYGNVSGSTSTQATQETTLPPAPTTQITTDANQDGYISATELNGSSSVSATVTLSTTAQTVLSNGGSVQVTVVDAGTTTNLNLHMSNGSLVDGSGNPYSYSGGVIGLTENAPGNGQGISVSATVTDTYGNVSPVSNVASAQQDVIDSPAVSIAFGTPTSSNLVLDTWVSNSTVNGLLYTSSGNNGDGANPGTLINTLTSTTVAPTAGTTTTLINPSVTAGTATEISGLVYMQAGHTYSFSGTEDDSFALVIGGKLVGSTTWGQGSGAFSGTFAASVTGWYTLAAYHDNESGPGQFNVNVSDNGATAVALNSTNFDLAPSVSALNSAGIALNAEVTNSTTASITTTAANSSGSGTVNVNLTGGYYTVKPVVDVTLDSSNQSIINSGGTLNVVGSDGTNVTLHWNGSALVDSSGNTYSYGNGVLALPLNATPTTSVVSASATVYDTHNVPSLTTTTHEIYSGSNSITEVVGGDTFKFELAANGAAGTPHVETLSAFNSNPVGNGGDVLNLADLLQGATSSNIANYLHFTSSSSGGVTTTTVHVSEAGAYASGYSAAADTLQIALTGANLLVSGGVTQTDAQIIQALLNKGKLVE